MRWSSFEKEPNIPEANFDYRFSINEFQPKQLQQLIVTAAQTRCNVTFKEMLQSHLTDQIKEEKNFYAQVKKKRLKITNRSMNKKILEKLHLPESWQQFILGKEKADQIEIQLRRWQAPDDINQVASAKYPKQELLASLQPGAVNLSGWERLKRAFFPSFFVPNYDRKEPSHTFNRDLLIEVSLTVGLAVGIVMAYSYGRSYVHEHDQIKTGNIYASKYDALRSRHDSFIKGYTRYAFRWGWRYAFLCGGLFLVSQGMCIYRLQDTLSNYVIGAAVPAALYKWTRGPKGMLVYGAIGGVTVGLPLGLIISAAEMNPRSALYDASVAPRLQSKYHWFNWTEEQLQLSEKRLQEIKNEMTIPEFVKRDESTYKVLLPDVDIS